MKNGLIVVVGTGFSGIGMGVLLRRAGIEDFVILEKAHEVGGTWRENHYPGAACDVPSHLYSFSFEPKADWSRAFSPQQEIQDYLRHCVAKYDLARHIRFGAHFEGGSFDEATGMWSVRIAGEPPLRARALVLGNGGLHIPALPELPGREQFEGRVFHSAEWDHEFDFKGKRVAVIGTGASAIQFVPEIAPLCAQLSVFQRTAPWVMPKLDRALSGVRQRRFARLPFLRWLHRARLYWQAEVGAYAFVVQPGLLKLLERFAKLYLAREVRDPLLRAKLTPSFRFGCKRVLLSNAWYRSLQRPNVELVTESIETLTPKGIRSRDGVFHPADAIIFGTGFAVGENLARLDLVGRGGRKLREVVEAGSETYLGITVHGFPNLFLLMGPNTGLGHNSMIFMIEAQVRYALQALQILRGEPLRFIDVRESVQHAFATKTQERLKHTVWSSGCQSWYLGPDGRNATLWPGFTVEYWWRTRKLARADYEFV